MNYKKSKFIYLSVLAFLCSVALLDRISGVETKLKVYVTAPSEPTVEFKQLTAFNNSKSFHQKPYKNAEATGLCPVICD